jgi:hypothetical protein
MTFTLISVVYACGVAKPGHGSFTPPAVGLSLVACAGTGKSLSQPACTGCKQPSASAASSLKLCTHYAHGTLNAM